MQDEIDALVAEHGTVPPPWVVFDEHPYTMRWRMGDGESHKLLWYAWWEQQAFSRRAKGRLLLPVAPPHCGLAFLIEAVGR